MKKFIIMISILFISCLAYAEVWGPSKNFNPEDEIEPGQKHNLHVESKEKREKENASTNFTSDTDLFNYGEQSDRYVGVDD